MAEETHEGFEGYLHDSLESVRDREDGEVNKVPSALADADVELLAGAVCSVDGEVFAAGDEDHEVTIQSASKPFVYGLVLEQLGLERMLEVVDVEPSGEAYNVISVEPGSKRPRNPMINAGAMTTHALVLGDEAEADERVEHIRASLSAMAGRDLRVDDDAAQDELAHTERNRAIAWMLRAEEVLPDDPRDVVDGYTRQCSLLVTVKDLAALASVAAGWLTVSVLVMAGIAASLGLVLRAYAGEPREGVVADVVVGATFGLYLGWICVAACANVASWLVGLGVPVDSGVPTAVTVLVLAVVVVLAGALMHRARRLPFATTLAAAVVWGTGWVSSGRFTGELRSDVVGWAAAATALAVACVWAALVVTRVSGRRRPA